MPNLAERALKAGRPQEFDTIMVDEAQDYRSEWWSILQMALTKNGEMLLVADMTQDVYGTGKAWTEETMNDMGFKGGRWAQLSRSYRLPALVQDYVRDFASRFLPTETADLPAMDQGTLNIEDCHLRWVQCSDGRSAEASVDEIRLMMRRTGERGTANADITFLTDDAMAGTFVVQNLDTKNIRTVSTFDSKNRQRRREKMGFYMGRAEIKATTLHSFKGWESRMIVVHVSQSWTMESKALVYAALTRLKRSPQGSWLTVVCAAPELAAYGKSWPDHHNRGHEMILFHAVSTA